MIKKFVIFLGIYFVFLFPAVSFAFSPLTGEELLNYCQVALDIHDRNMGRVQTENEYLQGVKTGVCEGYLRGFDDAGIRKTTCFPGENKRLVNIALIVKYLKDHPQQLSMPAATLVSNAFATYFRCRRD